MAAKTQPHSARWFPQLGKLDVFEQSMGTWQADKAYLVTQSLHPGHPGMGASHDFGWCPDRDQLRGDRCQNRRDDLETCRRYFRDATAETWSASANCLASTIALSPIARNVACSFCHPRCAGSANARNSSSLPALNRCAPKVALRRGRSSVRAC